MKLVRQPTKVTCGAACYAMIRACPIEEALEIVGNGWTTKEVMMQSLGLEMPLVKGLPSNDVVAIQYHQQPNGPGGHWTVWNKGELLDPAGIKRLWPVVEYKEI